jgi:predicted small lipoprotein YifL
MKKFFSMMAVVAAMFTFAACSEEAPQDPTPQKPAQKTQLEKPVVTITNVTETGFTVEWEAVANATEYLVYLNKDIQPKTTETSYTFTDLNAGKYQPRVKALGGENYKDSDYSDSKTVTITGATSVDWFTQTVALPEDDAETAAKGINSSNTFLFSWKGNGVASLSYMYYHIDELAGMSDDDIIADMVALDAESLAAVNAEGVEFMFNNLAGGQTYVMCALATKDGKEFLAKNEITTNATILTLGTQAWIGEWNASTPQIVDVTSNTFRDETTNFTLTVTAYNDFYSNYVWVDGFSVLGEGAPAFGVVSHEKVNGEYTGNYQLQLMCYETIGELGEGSGVYAVWMPLCSKGNSGYTFVMGSFAGYTLTLNPTTGAVTCKAYSGTLSDNSTFEVKMMDVFGLNESTKELYLMMMDEENAYTEYKAGGLQNVTKVAASASAASVAPKAMKASAVPASVVVAM